MDFYGFHLVSFRKSKTIFMVQSSEEGEVWNLFDNDSPEEGKGGRKKLYNAQTPPRPSIAESLGTKPRYFIFGNLPR